MILSLGRSFAETVGRHLQLYSLVLLRDAFKELSHFPEPVAVTSDDYHTLAVMGSDAVGAVLLFACATLFSRLQRHNPITSDRALITRFRSIKKAIALTLLLIFAGLGVRDLVGVFVGDGGHRMFDAFFTVLIFADVLLAIVSLGFTEVQAIIFRNFGFAFAAIVLRLAIASPEFVRPSLGLAGGIVAIAVTLTFNYSLPKDGPTPQDLDDDDP